MSIPSAVYGAAGGAVAVALLWVASSDPKARAPHSGREQQDPAGNHATSATGPAGTIASRAESTTPELRFPEASELGRDGFAPAHPNAVLLKDATARTPAGRSEEREPTREELLERVALVENRANAQLEALAIRLNLTETQQDRIFPILAGAAPAFHPVMRPEGGSPSGSAGVGTAADTVYGDGSGVRPGAPISEVENEIYPELNAVQQASIEEEAMDREAWWEDVVALLEEDLESSTSAGAVGGQGGGNSAPGTVFTEEERSGAGATNEVDDFSDLLFGK